MNWFKLLKIAAFIMVSGLIMSVVAILTLETEFLEHYKIFEVFGALLASSITIFGIIAMKKLTEE